MLICLPFHAGDKPLAIKLAEWIAELGGVKSHECMLIHPPSTDPSGLAEPLREAFGKVFAYRTPDDMTGWPMGANLLLRRAAHQIQGSKPQPWLWIEPDAVPLTASWLDTIAEEYRAGGKPFMGALVELKDIPAHMSGVAVYPGNAPTLAPSLIRANKAAFDVAAAKEIIPLMHRTWLIQHEWKPAPFETRDDLQRISEDAVIYHQDKAGGIPRLLRERMTEDRGKTARPVAVSPATWLALAEAQAADTAASVDLPDDFGRIDEPDGVQKFGGAFEKAKRVEFVPRTVRERADSHAALLAALAAESHANRITVANALKRAGLVREKAGRRKAKATPP